MQVKERLMEQIFENEKRVILSHVMTPDMVNFSGNIHGGHILLLLDQTAYACAVRMCIIKMSYVIMCFLAMVGVTYYVRTLQNRHRNFFVNE